jgi:hypothetical protein
MGRPHGRRHRAGVNIHHVGCRAGLFVYGAFCRRRGTTRLCLHGWLGAPHAPGAPEGPRLPAVAASRTGNQSKKVVTLPGTLGYSEQCLRVTSINREYNP